MFKMGLFLLIFGVISLEAKVLEFKPGQKACYKVEYKIEGDPRFEEAVIDSAIKLDIRIVEGVAYPFQVQIDLKKTTCNGFDTGDGGNSLFFTVISPDQVEELSGLEIHPVTENSLKIFLGQLFQLSEGNLRENQCYRMFSYYLLHDWDLPINADEYVVFENSQIDIKSVTEKEMMGSWKGHSVAKDLPVFEGRVDVDGTIGWNLKNPLVQQRKNTLQLLEVHRNYNDGIQTVTSVRIHQKWVSSKLP